MTSSVFDTFRFHAASMASLADRRQGRDIEVSTPSRA